MIRSKPANFDLAFAISKEVSYSIVEIVFHRGEAELEAFEEWRSL